MRARTVAIPAGGALGASLRWFAVEHAPASAFPWPVFAINVVGSFVLGVALAGHRPDSSPLRTAVLVDLIGIGFCGGLTTFSTFAVETLDLGGDGRVALAAVYVVTSIAAALTAVEIGGRFGHRLARR